MDGSHESLIDSESIVDDLAQRSEAIGGTGSVGNNCHVRVVGFVVDTIDESWGIVLGWGSEDDLLSTSGKMPGNALLSKENSCGFAEVLGTGVSPLAVSWVSLVENFDEFSIDKKTSISDFDGSWESSVDGIEFEEIFQVFEVLSWSVDSDASSFVSLIHEGGSEDKSSNSSETIDSHFDNHGIIHMAHFDVNVGVTGNLWSGEHLDVSSSRAALFNSRHVSGTLHLGVVHSWLLLRNLLEFGVV